MTDLIEKMFDEIFDNPEAEVSFDGMRAATSVLLRAMMEPTDEMLVAGGVAFIEYCNEPMDDENTAIFQHMLKAFARSHSINIEDGMDELQRLGQEYDSSTNIEVSEMTMVKQ